MDTIMSKMTSRLCHDTNDPLNGFRLPRGQAGVAILWPQEWNGRIKRLKLGNDRIIAITVASSSGICLEIPEEMFL
jgi:hypothetical protein